MVNQLFVIRDVGVIWEYFGKELGKSILKSLISLIITHYEFPGKKKLNNSVKHFISPFPG